MNEKHIQETMSAFESAADSEAMLDFIRSGWTRLRRQSAEFDAAHADAVLDRMNNLGMSECWKGSVPADGATSFGGWVMPQRFHVEHGTIIVAKGECAGLALFDHSINPTALMLRSGGTPGKVTAPLVALEEKPGANLKGHVALLRRPDLQLIRSCFAVGIIGVVCDTKPYRAEVQDGPELDSATAWLNYAMPPWREERGFGVTITPRNGELLRKALAAGAVMLEANISARPADAVVPVVSAVWPEGRREEVVLTGHIDEIGADDNLSGVAVSIEVIRCYQKLVREKRLPPPRRGIRLIFGPEVYGLQSYIADDKLPWRKFRVGLNVDCVGSNQERVNSWMFHGETFPTAPHCADTLVEEILRIMRARHPRFRYADAGVDVIDNGIADPDIGAPTPQLYHFTAHHHTNLDRPECLDPVMLARSTAIAGAYVAVFANPDAASAAWLAERAFAQGIAALSRAVIEKSETASAICRTLIRKHRIRLASTADLVPQETVSIFASDYSSPREALDKHAAHAPLRHARRAAALDAELVAAAVRWSALVAPANFAMPAEDNKKPADSLTAYRKKFRGLVGTESLLGAGHEKLRALGYRPHWGAPLWLIMACFLCDGRRSVLDVERELESAGYSVAGKNLGAVLAVLSDGGLLEPCPVIAKKDIVAALRKAGVADGDILLAQVSLPRFGYVVGGSEAMVSALRRAVGTKGTLLMPAFSLSYLGTEPFKPDSSPSRSGEVSDVFRCLKGVARSLHPTHSFCARGPLARPLLKGHEFCKMPFSLKGPVGRLAKSGGKIAMLDDPEECMAFLAAAPNKAGARRGAYAVLKKENGREELAKVEPVPENPDFKPAFDILKEQGRVQSAPLGRGTLSVFSVRDALAAMRAARK